MPNYHPIFLTGEPVSLAGEDGPVVITSTSFHHGGDVLHTFGRYDRDGILVAGKSPLSERDFLDNQFGWKKIEASSVYDIRGELRSGNPYAVVSLRSNGMELLVSYQPDLEDFVRSMREVSEVRDATMFSYRYGFSVHNLDLTG